MDIFLVHLNPFLIKGLFDNILSTSLDLSLGRIAYHSKHIKSNGFMQEHYTMIDIENNIDLWKNMMCAVSY